MTRIIIFNAIIVNELARYSGYVIIEGEFIKEVGKGIPSEYQLNSCNEHIDADGSYLFPGVIDDHVHFRDPGLTYKADVASESRAAVAGGVTTYMDMPNTKPVTTTIDDIKAKIDNAAEKSHANYSFYLGATNENVETLEHADYSHICGVKLFLGSSTGNMLVDKTDTLKRIYSAVPTLVAVHAESESIIRANKEKYIAQYGEDLPISFHPLIRDVDACYECTARAVELADKCSTRLHVMHLSTAKELTLFENSPLDCNKRITAEAVVAHLWFTDADYENKGALIKCNPSIKSGENREALRVALSSNIIDVIGTDHAPHLLSEKQGGALTAMSGMPSIQYSLLIMLELERKGIISLEQVVNKMSHAPAELFRIEKRGYIRQGYYADLVLVNRKENTLVNKDNILSKCGWSPLEGEVFSSKVVTTFVNGYKAYESGKVNEKPNGQLLNFKN